MARHNVQPSLGEDVFRPWSPRVELWEQGAPSYCKGAMDLRACPGRGDTHVDGEGYLWREPEVRTADPLATSFMEVDAAPPVGLEVSYCAANGAVVVAFLAQATWRVEGCNCWVDRREWRWAASPDRLPEGWPCEGAALLALDSSTAVALGLPAGR